jgi:hypothetical protein
MIYCINKGKIKNLTIGKKYKVIKTQSGEHSDSKKPYNGVWIINDSGREHYYSLRRFISELEYRDQILNELGIR